MSKNEVKYEGAFTSDTRKTINDNLRDVAVSTANLTANANTTLANVTGLVTGTLKPGTYTYRVNLSTSAGASGGLKVAFKQSVASMLTSLEGSSLAKAAAAVVVTRTSSATDAASLIASTSAVISAELTGTFVVAAEGTIQVQAAQNASNGTDTIVYAGSFLEVTKVG